VRLCQSSAVGATIEAHDDRDLLRLRHQHGFQVVSAVFKTPDDVRAEIIRLLDRTAADAA
jgi:hypothetical protein